MLGSDVDHISPSLLLVFDKARFMFNAGEGLQRLMREKKIKMSKVGEDWAMGSESLLIMRDCL